MSDPFADLDAVAQAELVRRGQVTPRELVDAAIARIERLNPGINAVIHTMFEKARQQAASPALPNGPFRGVPFLAKDLGGQTAGDPYHAGMRFLRDARWTEAEDSYLAAKLRAAGFVFLGRTNTPELGLLPTSEPEAYGATKNPWDPGRSAGGSSGGAGAAVASRMVPAAHASDGGGSIRIPASHCGLVGLKPTRGRSSFGPGAGERWGGCSVELVVSRSVRDTAAILDVVAGPMPGDPYFAPPPVRPYRHEAGADPGRLRIGFTAKGPRALTIHPDCAAAAAAAARALEASGHVVEEACPAALDETDAVNAFVTVVACNIARALDVWGAKVGRPVASGDVEPLTWALAEMTRGLPVTRYLEAIDHFHGFGRRMASWWKASAGGGAPAGAGFDLLLTPTVGEPPPPLGQFTSSPNDPFRGFSRSAIFGAYTSAFNMTGQPAVSLPVFWNAAGLPIGAHLVAAYGREDLLIRVAAQLEQALPWNQRRAVLSA